VAKSGWVAFRRRGYEESIALLLKWKRGARAIRNEGDCHCKKKCIMLSYLDENSSERVLSGGQIEVSCGYYCGSCGWGNAGGRPKVEPK